ncbi:hypothetical protein KGM_200611 [Danaus plexippus plexippus]|uniref:Uncharacterized protein n=1 Tax=Danaus plexippus plexippus TaxID=278856 RepID=A0A212FCG1_DANPL|nr:hypothetical protein KGM_200611 [Danaus plexippus plexippus]
MTHGSNGLARNHQKYYLSFETRRLKFVETGANRPASTQRRYQLIVWYVYSPAASAPFGRGVRQVRCASMARRSPHSTVSTTTITSQHTQNKHATISADRITTWATIP